MSLLRFLFITFYCVWCVCMYGCMDGWMYGWMDDVGVCVTMQMDQIRGHQVSCGIIFHLIPLRQDLLDELGVRLAANKSQWSFCTCFLPQCWDYKTWRAWFLIWILEFEFRTSGLLNKFIIIWLSSSGGPIPLFCPQYFSLVSGGFAMWLVCKLL